jgi:hypothetical protein
VNKKYFILIVAVLAVIHYLPAGSAPPAAPAPIARQANVAPIAPQPVAPNGPLAPIAPIGPMPVAAPTAPVTIAPIANLAPVSPTPPQSVNSNFPYAYTYMYVSNSPNFSNGIPTAYSKNPKSVYWITNAPYGNPVSGYTNRTDPVTVKRVPPLTTNSTLPDQ